MSAAEYSPIPNAGSGNNPTARRHYSGMASTLVPATAVLRFEETTLFFKRPSLTRERLEGFLNQFALHPTL
jgi:hypothetical protein